MVEIATSLGRSGLQDWLIQRISAIILGLYTLFLAGYCILQRPVSYSDWQQLWALSSMRYASVFALLSLLAHAWIGFWNISVDYLKNWVLRLGMQLLFILAIVLNLAWGIHILLFQ